MTTYPLSQGLVDTKIRFSMTVLSMGALITFGSFFLIGYLQFTFQTQFLALSALGYKIEYIALSQNRNLFAAVGDAFSADTLVVNATNGSAQAVPVLTYHSVLPDKSDELKVQQTTFEGANISLSRFKEQMFALKMNGWQSITLEDYEAFMAGKKKLPAKSFLLTFDDGAKNSFYPVDPILAALGYGAVTFILPAHSLGSNSTYYLNKVEVDLLLSTGRWEVESHGEDIHTSTAVTADGSKMENPLSNRIWLPIQGRLETHEEYNERITNDLTVAKQHLQDAFDIEVHAFAFPFGDFGQNGSNDAAARDTVLAATQSQYSLAFYQNWNQGNFSYNYPSDKTFMVKRIPVSPNWSGAQLVTKLASGMPKPLPYEDTMFANNVGWQITWGEGGVSPQGLELRAASTTTGAIALLDGSYTWSDYRVDMSVEWTQGYAILLFDMQSDRSGRACVFSSDGGVQLQERTPDDILILRESKHKNVSGGAHTIGAVSNGTTTACVFDGEFVIDAELPAKHGGIGIESWSPTINNSELFIKKTSVNKNK